MEEDSSNTISVDNAPAASEDRRSLVATGLLAAASGLLLGLAFWGGGLSLLAWIALVPLLVAVRRGGFWRACAAGLVTGAVFFGMLLYWTAIFGGLAVAGLVGVMALTMAVFAGGAWWLSSRLPMPWPLAAIPALLVLIEALRAAGPWGFSWGILGYSQQQIPPVAQFASLAGVLGLSAALALANACLAEVFLARKREIARFVASGGVAIVTVMAVLGWGLARASTPVELPRLTVAGVQPSIDQWAKFDSSQADSIMRILGAQTRAALRERPAILIWPETAVPSSYSEDNPFLQRMRLLAARQGADFLYGSFEPTPEGGITNSALLATPLGTVSRYNKVHLVPFGEYVPLRPLIGNIGLLRMVTVDQRAASAPVLLDSSWGRVGGVICFESSDATLVRRVVNLGAKLLVVVTNDGWFNRTAASEQHFRITAMRAIENGIYTVQVSNNGISGIIDPRGRVLARTRLWDRTVMLGRVGLGAEETPYRRVGDWPLIALSIVSLGCGVVVGIRGSRQL